MAGHPLRWPRRSHHGSSTLTRSSRRPAGARRSDLRGARRDAHHYPDEHVPGRGRPGWCSSPMTSTPSRPGPDLQPGDGGHLPLLERGLPATWRSRRSPRPRDHRAEHPLRRVRRRHPARPGDRHGVRPGAGRCRSSSRAAPGAGRPVLRFDFADGSTQTISCPTPTHQPAEEFFGATSDVAIVRATFVSGPAGRRVRAVQRDRQPDLRLGRLLPPLCAGTPATRAACSGQRHREDSRQGDTGIGAVTLEPARRTWR